MPTYSFPTNILVGDLGQTSWANSIGAALNELGPLVDAKATDNAVVKLTGAQTVGGVKTFTSAPVVPNSSFSIAKTTGLQTELDKIPVLETSVATKAATTYVNTQLATKASATDLDNVFGIATAAVPKTTTVNGKPLSDNVTLIKSDIGLGNVENVADADKPISTATQTALNLKAPLANPTFTGNVAGVTKTHVGLSNVDNTSDANKPISTATQTALNLKAPLASPAFTGTPTGITKAHVGLSNVDNTSDANKPISTATQTALDLKVGSPNSTVVGMARYATVGDLPATGTAGVIYFVDTV